MATKNVKATTIDLKQGGRKFFLTKLPAQSVCSISYAAVRNVDDEDGSVQRLLNTRRVSSIKEFTLQGGDFPNCIILNWVSKKNPIKHSNGILTFDEHPKSAQIIDGQHRVAGIEAAILEDKAIGKLELPVVIYQNLTTRECADIFLAINTEQKPVAKSLVYDLYGVASDNLVDVAAVRARDITAALNEDLDSPYHGLIKEPNAPKRKGGIGLSTVINAIKPLVEPKGGFEQIDITELETQQQIIFNLFSALKTRYGATWDETTNAFAYGAGFSAAILFLKNKLLPYCNTQETFTQKTMFDAIKLNESNLILQEDVKGYSGGEAIQHIYEKLNDCFVAKTKTKRSIAV